MDMNTRPFCGVPLPPNPSPVVSAVNYPELSTMNVSNLPPSQLYYSSAFYGALTLLQGPQLHCERTETFYGVALPPNPIVYAGNYRNFLNQPAPQPYCISAICAVYGSQFPLQGPQLPMFFGVSLPPNPHVTDGTQHRESSTIIASDFSKELPQPHSPNNSEARSNEKSRKRKVDTFHEYSNDPDCEKNGKVFKFKTETLSDDDSNEVDEKLFECKAEKVADDYSNDSKDKKDEKLFKCKAEKLSEDDSNDYKNEKDVKLFKCKTENPSENDSNDSKNKKDEKLFKCKAEKLSDKDSNSFKNEKDKKLFKCKAGKLSDDDSDGFESKKDEKLFKCKAEKLSDKDSNSFKNEKYEKLFKCKAEKLSDDDSGGFESKKDVKLLKCKVEKSSDDEADSNDFEFKQESQIHVDQNPNIVGHICEAVFNRGGDENLDENGTNLSAVINDHMKCKLPSFNIKSEPETDDGSFCVKNYEWEKLVDNPFVRRIDDNMKRTVDLILLPEHEYKRILNEVIRDLNDAFNVKGIENRWHCYGSYLYGLVCGDTKIDLSYESSPLNHVSEKLRQRLWASVRFNKNFEKMHEKEFCSSHLKTGKRFSVSFSKELDISRSRLMKLYLDTNPNLKYLFVFVNLLLNKFRNHITSRDDLPSHAVFWLVVFFMQQKNQLPAVIDVRKAAEVKHRVSEWNNCSLPEEYCNKPEPVSLYSLLLGFFEFYKNFDFWDYAICPYLGRVLAVSDLEILKIPADEFSAHIEKFRNPDEITFSRNLWNLQDPTDLSVNLIKNGAGLNEFKVMCHLLGESLPKCLAEMERMDCFCHILPDSINSDVYNPCNFTKYAQLVEQRECIISSPEVNLSQNDVLVAIRRIMEVGYRLEPISIVIDQDIHLEYCSSEKTWKNDYLKNNFLGDEVEELIRIRLRCELYSQMNRIGIFCAGNARFLRLLKPNFINMLRIIIIENVCF